MNPADAVAAWHDLGGPNSLGIHHGSLQLTDEAIDAPRKELEEALRQRAVANDRFRVIEPGDHWQVPGLDKSA